MTPIHDPSAAAGELQVAVQIACQGTGIPDERDLSRWAAATYREMRGEAAEVAIRVVGRDEMQALNLQYRGADKPTNVLSFPMGPVPEAGQNLLGDIVICRDVVLDEATTQGKEATAHWAHMVVHGVLHLCGYDHEVEDDASRMEALESEIIAKLGFTTPW